MDKPMKVQSYIYIEESIDAAIAVEQARHANARNVAKGSGLVRGQDVTPTVRECTFAGFMKCNPIVFCGTKGAVSSGSLPVCECCFSRHVGPCMIKCYKCRKVGHKSRYCKEKSVSTGANAQPVWTCYDCGKQGHTSNRCLKKVKQEETGKVHGRAYAINNAEPLGPNVVTGMFLLNNHYAIVLFDSGSDRSFVDTRFSSMLDINPIKIDAIYEKPKEKRLKDVPVIRDFPEVFPANFPGLPPSRQAEF
nr:hypothetical protein [Tanacetum cinerariifolium]